MILVLGKSLNFPPKFCMNHGVVSFCRWYKFYLSVVSPVRLPPQRAIESLTKLQRMKGKLGKCTVKRATNSTFISWTFSIPDLPPFKILLGWEHITFIYEEGFMEMSIHRQVQEDLNLRSITVQKNICFWLIEEWIMASRLPSVNVSLFFYLPNAGKFVFPK